MVYVWLGDANRGTRGVPHFSVMLLLHCSQQPTEKGVQYCPSGQCSCSVHTPLSCEGEPQTFRALQPVQEAATPLGSP